MVNQIHCQIFEAVYVPIALKVLGSFQPRCDISFPIVFTNYSALIQMLLGFNTLVGVECRFDESFNWMLSSLIVGTVPAFGESEWCQKLFCQHLCVTIYRQYFRFPLKIINNCHLHITSYCSTRSLTCSEV